MFYGDEPEVSFNFEEALEKAIEVLKKERIEAIALYDREPTEVHAETVKVYKKILDRLDTLL